MDDDNRDGRTPMFIMASLLALGASGRRGQRRLIQLKRLCGWGFLQSFFIIPSIMYFSRAVVRTVGDETSLMLLGLSFVVSALSAVFWCYLAIAKWMTSDDEDDDEDRKRR